MAKRKKQAKARGRSDAEAASPEPPPSPQVQNVVARAPDLYGVERWSLPHAPNPAMLRDQLARDGYTVYQWSDPPGTIYGMHRHETKQSHWIISGELEITVQGRGTFLLKSGDRDVMPANTYHSARVAGDEAALYLVGELVPYSPRR